MPFVGIGLHVLLAIFCAVHVLRNQQQLYWLFILFSFPLLGSIVYLVAIVLPHSRLERGARRAVRSAAQAMDPGRALREARTEFEETPTAQNQMRLAAALMEAGEGAQAAEHYQACLKGPFAKDLEIRLGAARALEACGQPAAALAHLASIRKEQPAFRPEAVSLLTARCLAALDRQADAKAEFESASERFGSVEAWAEHAIWAIGRGDEATAQPLLARIDKVSAKWNALTRALNEPVMRRLQVARKR
ncbi:tetratricopeptide repeat protein [Roseateles amylovorans]|uniref:Tetratricopeptide repeat protein n=1 Tax=Roseateles amylovorans TaxID=2978473 RepID=A0ABY6AVG3_9BURK|nr:tetratricopeptide repeat protein [Roseateles amylovorans]UXH76992.1 tetratricopeptide repeat protein [Roseateles amylovorans]